MITIWGVRARARRTLKLAYIYITDRELGRYPWRLKLLWFLMSLGFGREVMARMALALYKEPNRL